MAKNNVISILSSQFKEKLRFLMSFQSVIGDADVSQAIKGKYISICIFIYNVLCVYYLPPAYSILYSDS